MATAVRRAKIREITARIICRSDSPDRNSRALSFEIFNLSRVFVSGSLTMAAEAENIIIMMDRISRPGT